MNLALEGTYDCIMRGAWFVVATLAVMCVNIMCVGAAGRRPCLHRLLLWLLADLQHAAC